MIREAHLDIVRFYQDNPAVSMAQIGAKFGVTRQRIFQILKKNGVKTRSTLTTLQYRRAHILNKVLSDYDSFVRPSDIARKHQISISICYSIIKRHRSKEDRQTRKVRWVQIVQDTVIKDYEHYGQEFIARHHGLGLTKVRKILAARGLNPLHRRRTIEHRNKTVPPSPSLRHGCLAQMN